ncbi:two-component response regulator ARR12-like [Durio zibethinus]|uniref:Two-component response regulator ARR12-like n=1 Tax=Durio zibethinus TaxID=66656 RepID=A0A6P5ZMQ7_DURZI|nr:two-component response regulator ARR12-like [Durio zibethinus]
MLYGIALSMSKGYHNSRIRYNLLNKPYEMNPILEVDDDIFDDIRVLAIDAQIFSLQYLCAVLHKCNYKVKTTPSAAEALELLRANKRGFDIVLVDVDGGNLNGYKLLETIGLEMYLPVIMVTGDGSLENIRKGLIYGAVDYMIKPIGVQEIKNTIQRCVTLNKIRDSEQSSDWQETSNDQKLKPLEHSNAKVKIQSDGASSSSWKKKRLSWTPELDAKFVKAVQRLEKCSMVHPKKILDIMNEPGLTRENIASHLQKYRISLKKRKAKTNQQGFELERVIRSSSTSRSTNRRKWEVGDVNADHLAVPKLIGLTPSRT